MKALALSRFVELASLETSGGGPAASLKGSTSMSHSQALIAFARDADFLWSKLM